MTDASDKLAALDVEAFLVESVNVDPLRIQDHYCEVPAQFAYWSHQYALADRGLKLAKMDEERTRATLALAHRQRLVDAGLKPTESQVEAKVATDPEMTDVTRERIEAEFQERRLKGVVSAVAMKSQSLMSLGAHVRKEMEGDPQVRRAYANAATAAGYGHLGGD